MKLNGYQIVSEMMPVKNIAFTPTQKNLIRHHGEHAAQALSRGVPYSQRGEFVKQAMSTRPTYSYSENEEE